MDKESLLVSLYEQMNISAGKIIHAEKVDNLDIQRFALLAETIIKISSVNFENVD